MIDKPEFETRALGIARRLFRIAYAILGNAHDCEDAVQQALERAWVGRAGLREDAHFETWLVRILINTSRSMLKARGRFPCAWLAEAVQALPVARPLRGCGSRLKNLWPTCLHTPKSATRPS